MNRSRPKGPSLLTRLLGWAFGLQAGPIAPDPVFVSPPCRPPMAAPGRSPTLAPFRSPLVETLVEVPHVDYGRFRVTFRQPVSCRARVKEERDGWEAWNPYLGIWIEAATPADLVAELRGAILQALGRFTFSPDGDLGGLHEEGQRRWKETVAEVRSMMPSDIPADGPDRILEVYTTRHVQVVTRGRFTGATSEGRRVYTALTADGYDFDPRLPLPVFRARDLGEWTGGDVRDDGGEA